jgi:hypothetical protein
MLETSPYCALQQSGVSEHWIFIQQEQHNNADQQRQRHCHERQKCIPGAVQDGAQARSLWQEPLQPILQ